MCCLEERSSLFLCDPEGKRVCVSVYLGSHGSYHKYVEESQECAIGIVSISGKTKWEMLDAMIRRVFKVCYGEIRVHSYVFSCVCVLEVKN